MLFRTCLPFVASVLLVSLARSTEAPLQQWIDEAIRAGSGVVTVPPGEHLLPAGLKIKDAKKLAIRGMDREHTILKLPPLAYAECAEQTPSGSKRMRVRQARNWLSGMVLHIEAEGAIDSFTKKPKPYVTAVLEKVAEGEFSLRAPLAFPIPVGAVIRHADAPNLIDIKGAVEEIEIANLTLDGGLVEGDPKVQGHAQLCAVFVHGPYDYEKGPTGPPIKGIKMHDCVIQNCFGRGVALYSVVDSSIERCSFRDCNDEAIDLDHFAVNCVVRGNQINRCRIGVEMNDASKCLVEGNEIRQAATGLTLWRWCRQPGLNEENVIRNNLVIASAGNGFQIGSGTAKNVIEGNTIEAAGRNGISLSGEGQIVRRNVITGAKLKPVAVNEGTHQIDPPQ